MGVKVLQRSAHLSQNPVIKRLVQSMILGMDARRATREDTGGL